MSADGIAYRSELSDAQERIIMRSILWKQGNSQLCDVAAVILSRPLPPLSIIQIERNIVCPAKRHPISAFASLVNKL